MQFIHSPLLSSWKYCSMTHTHFSNEIDVTLSLLDIWRTLGRNSVSRMSFIPLRCIKDRRHETNLQLIFPILQPVSNWEILQKTTTTEFLTTQSRKMTKNRAVSTPDNLRIYGTCCPCCQLWLHWAKWMKPCQRHQKREEPFLWLFWNRTNSSAQYPNNKVKVKVKIFTSAP